MSYDNRQPMPWEVPDQRAQTPPQQAQPQAPWGAPQTPPQQAQPQNGMQQNSTPDIASMMAGSTAGAERFPLLTGTPDGAPAHFQLQVVSSEMGRRSSTWKVVLEVLNTDNPSFPPGQRVHELFPLGGSSQDQMEARRGACKRFVMCAVAALGGVPYGDEAAFDQIAPGVYRAMNYDPGPFVGAKIVARVSDGGKRTRESNEVIWEKNWSVSP